MITQSRTHRAHAQVHTLVSIDKLTGQISVLSGEPGELADYPDDLRPMGDFDVVRIGSNSRFIEISRVETSNPAEVAIEVHQDYGSSIPAFYWEDSRQILFSNNDARIFKFLKAQSIPISISKRAILRFLKFGFLAPPSTFVEGLELIGGSWRYGWNRDKPVTSKRTSLDSPVATSDIAKSSIEERLTQSLREALDQDFADTQLQIFCMSGGIDSRTITMLLNDREIKNLQVILYTSANPEEDADAQAARLVVRQLGMKCWESIHDGTYSRLFPFEKNGVSLSGLYGGEILGGTMFAELPDVQEIPDAWYPDGKPPTDIYADAAEVLGDSIPRYVDVYRRSYRTVIYGHVSRSWWAPWKQLTETVSPFGHPEFLKVIETVPADKIRNYEMYTRVLRRVAMRGRDSLLRIPLCSQITDVDKELKSIVSLEKRVLNFKESQRLTRLTLDQQRVAKVLIALERCGLQLDEKQLARGMDDLTMGPRLRSLLVWLKSNAPSLMPDLVSSSKPLSGD